MVDGHSSGSLEAIIVVQEGHHGAGAEQGRAGGEKWSDSLQESRSPVAVRKRKQERLRGTWGELRKDGARHAGKEEGGGGEEGGGHWE